MSVIFEYSNNYNNFVMAEDAMQNFVDQTGKRNDLITDITQILPAIKPEQFTTIIESDSDIEEKIAETLPSYRASYNEYARLSSLLKSSIKINETNSRSYAALMHNFDKTWIMIPEYLESMIREYSKK